MNSKSYAYGLMAILILLSLACSLAASAGGLPTNTPVGAGAVSLPVDTHTSTPTYTDTVTPLPLILTASPSPTHTETATHTPSPSATPTKTRTPTETPTPTITQPPTITPTPTFSFPTITVKMQANCRYGPGVAYLYAHGMYTGDTGIVWGRNAAGTWLWIQPDNIEYQCWIAASVVDVQGDIFTVAVARVRLPQSTLYGPPQGVTAVRNEDKVIVSWEAVPMTQDDDRGYLIEATVCQDGNLVWVAVAVVGTSYEFTDEQSCDSPSSGLLYTVEKHGYTEPAAIPWPE
jgi:hypothetical protein